MSAKAPRILRVLLRPWRCDSSPLTGLWCMTITRASPAREALTWARAAASRAGGGGGGGVQDGPARVAGARGAEGGARGRELRRREVADDRDVAQVPGEGP